MREYLKIDGPYEPFSMCHHFSSTSANPNATSKSWVFNTKRLLLSMKYYGYCIYLIHEKVIVEYVPRKKGEETLSTSSVVETDILKHPLGKHYGLT